MLVMSPCSGSLLACEHVEVSCVERKFVVAMDHLHNPRQMYRFNTCTRFYTRQNVGLWTALLKCQIIRTSTVSDVGLAFWHRSFTFNSNKSPIWCNSFSVYYPEVCLQLNMFRAFSRPSSRAEWLQWQPLVLASYHGDSCAVFVVGPAGPTMNTARLSPRYGCKTRGCHCSHSARDDGWENARNMLSCKQTSG
jgi:hypothetical protein